MPEKTDRSNCRFVVKQTEGGKSALIVNLYQDTIPSLKNAVIGFDLLGGLRPEAARQLVDAMNENILDLFVTVKQP
jgi:hypothetical protein